MSQSEVLIKKVLKLSNGETIIGNVVRETVSYIEIENPLKFMTYMTNSGRMSISIMKWDPTFDTSTGVRIYKTSLVACADPSPDILQNYNEIIQDGLHLDNLEVDTPEEESSNVDSLIDTLLKTYKSDIIH